MTLLEVNNLKKIYSSRFGGASVQALSNVTFSVEQANIWRSWASPAPARRRC